VRGVGLPRHETATVTDAEWQRLRGEYAAAALRDYSDAAAQSG